jgi:hypothetical protein
MLDHLDEPVMFYGIEELTYIQIQHPVHFLFRDAIRKRIQRIMLTALWPKTIRKPFKIRFMNVIDLLPRPVLTGQ